MKFKMAAVKRVTRPEKQFLYLTVGRFLKQSRECDVALDLACGPMPLADKIRAKRYIGVDLNEESLCEGVARHPNAFAVHSTIEEIAAETSGDIVLCLQCIGVNKNFQVGNTLSCVRRMVDATNDKGALLFNVGPACREYFDQIDAILKPAFTRVNTIPYGRFYDRRSTATTLSLAYLMYYLPILARDNAKPRRLYICQDRKPRTASRVPLAA